MEKFGYVEMECPRECWTNQFTYDGMYRLQNKLQYLEITKKNILDVFKTTQFLHYDWKVTNIEVVQFFPENGFALVIVNGQYSIKLRWNTDYALLQRISELENRVKELEDEETR